MTCIRERPMTIARLATLTAAACLFATPATSQEPVHWDVVDQIRAEGFENSSVMDYAGYLTDVIGPRLTGSPNIRQAQDWVIGQLGSLGLQNVQRDPWGDESPGWDIERVSVHMIEPDYQMVIAYPFALTPGTDGPIVERAVIAEIRTPDDLERYREAEDFMLRALAIYEKALGPENPKTAESIHYLAHIYHRHFDRFEDAEELYRRALAINQAVLGPDDPSTQLTLGELQELLQEQDREEDLGAFAQE